MACRLATSPTRISPFLLNATTDGVIRDPSAFGITTGSPASMVEMTEFVVPRSIPTAFAMHMPPRLRRWFVDVSNRWKHESIPIKFDLANDGQRGYEHCGMPLPRFVARLNRVGLNRLTSHIAPHIPGFGVMEHRGRRSGRPYRTPINVCRAPGGYRVAL